MGAIVLVVGVVGLGAVIGAVVVLAVLRSRRNSNPGPFNPGAGTPPQSMGYAPQHPGYSTAQQAYPSAAPNQGYPAHPGQQPQYPAPRPHQPPHQGR